ncbi:unnamed protein product [Cuscuta epithymum]|uniref:Uncharacterized protein n=1 Tax=Cuscuta epithymum TaxID=186058 RepID=A0AAV0DXH6_9ASTE|nr:unnamed protein product [Cuscuta epithymum]
MHFKQHFLGLEIANIVACEGVERLERPETYKKWQSRTMRVGFKPLPVSPEILKKLCKMSEAYHKLTKTLCFTKMAIGYFRGGKVGLFRLALHG